MKTLKMENTIVPPVDMTYRFQLQQLMKEVAESVRQESILFEKQHREFLRYGFKPIPSGDEEG